MSLNSLGFTKQGQKLVSAPPTDHLFSSNGATPHAIAHNINARACEYEGRDIHACLFRYGPWALLLLFIIVGFIASFMIMAAILSVRASAFFEEINGQDTTDKLSTIVDMAVQGAEDAQLATRNILHVTEYARSAASIATPRLVHAVNETSDLVEDLRSWSFHPSLSIAPGLKGPG